MWLAGGQGWGYQTDIGDGGLERDIFFFLLDELQSADFRGRQCRHRVIGIVNHSEWCA